MTTPNVKPLYSSSPCHRIATSIAPVATSTGRSSEGVILPTNAPTRRSDQSRKFAGVAVGVIALLLFIIIGVWFWSKLGKIAGAAVGVIALVFFIIIGVWIWRPKNCAPCWPRQTAFYNYYVNEAARRHRDPGIHAGHKPAANVTVNPRNVPLTFPSLRQQAAAINNKLKRKYQPEGTNSVIKGRHKNPLPSAVAQDATQTFGPSQTTLSSFENPTFYNDVNEEAYRHHDPGNHVRHEPAANVTVDLPYAPYASTVPSIPQQAANNYASLYHSVSETATIGEQSATHISLS